MESPDNFDCCAGDWVAFKAWLKAAHIKGNDCLGMGQDDIGFVAYSLDHCVDHKDLPVRLQIRNDVVQILQDPDDDPSCYICLVDECNAVPIQMQISWARHFLLPVEESDYCVCEECKGLIPDDDIKRFRLEAGRMDLLPRTCDDCAERID